MEHNFYTLMLIFLGVIFVVFVIMVLSMTLINYFGAMHYIKTEQKKREKLGIEYFFQDEDGNELPAPIKNEDFSHCRKTCLTRLLRIKNAECRTTAVQAGKKRTASLSSPTKNW